jgi:hypothetical protein
MKDERVRTLIPTEFVAGTVKAQGKIRNLGSKGLFIRTGVIPEQGDPVLLRFEAPDGEYVAAEGLVWWTTQAPEIGRDEAGFGVVGQDEQGFGVCVLTTSSSYRALLDRLTR